MASGFLKNGVDLDDIFEPRTTTAIAGTGLLVAGTDLSQRYEKLSSGTAAASTGILTAGYDANTKFAAKGSVSTYGNPATFRFTNPLDSYQGWTIVTNSYAGRADSGSKYLYASSKSYYQEDGKGSGYWTTPYIIFSRTFSSGTNPSGLNISFKFLGQEVGSYGSYMINGIAQPYTYISSWSVGGFQGWPLNESQTFNSVTIGPNNMTYTGYGYTNPFTISITFRLDTGGSGYELHVFLDDITIFPNWTP